MAFRMAWPQWHYAKLNEPEKHKRMVSRSSTYFMALNALMLVLMGVFMPFIVHTFLNEKFWSIGPTTFVLTLSVAVYALYFVFWVGSNVAKKNRLIPVITLIASAVNIGLNFLLVPELRHVGGGVDDGGRVRDPRGDRLLLLQPLVPDPLRVAPADHDRGGDGAHARRRLGDRPGARAATWTCRSTSSSAARSAMTPLLLVFPLVLWATGSSRPASAGSWAEPAAGDRRGEPAAPGDGGRGRRRGRRRRRRRRADDGGPGRARRRRQREPHARGSRRRGRARRRSRPRRTSTSPKAGARQCEEAARDRQPVPAAWRAPAPRAWCASCGTCRTRAGSRRC